MNYCRCFSTEADAIEHCREANRGLDSKDSSVCCVVAGPGCCSGLCWVTKHPDNCHCCDYAVVDVETAKDLLEGSDASPLIVTG
jgi:hypothetical protein